MVVKTVTRVQGFVQTSAKGRNKMFLQSVRLLLVQSLVKRGGLMPFLTWLMHGLITIAPFLLVCTSVPGQNNVRDLILTGVLRSSLRKITTIAKATLVNLKELSSQF